MRLNLPTLNLCVYCLAVRLTDSLCVRAIRGTQAVLASLFVYIRDIFIYAWLKDLGPGEKLKCFTLSDCDSASVCWVSVFLKLGRAQRARVGKGSIITRGIPPQNGNWKWIQHTLLTSDLQPKQRQDREERWREEGEGEGKRQKSGGRCWDRKKGIKRENPRW